MTPQLIGDDIINIQNVDATNQDLPTETEDYTKLQAISEYQPENQPSALRHVQTKAGHVNKARKIRPGSSYIKQPYTKQNEALANIYGENKIAQQISQQISTNNFVRAAAGGSSEEGAMKYPNHRTLQGRSNKASGNTNIEKYRNTRQS